MRLLVTDNGRGFDPETLGTTKSGGFGLITMRERSASVDTQNRPLIDTSKPTIS